MTVQTVNKIGLRAGLFLQDRFSGPHKDKRVSAALNVSVGMAKLLRAGQSWTVERLDQMASLYGDEFCAFLMARDTPPAAPIVPAFSADQCFWVTDEFHAAPYGHQEFARRFLGASPLVEVDLCALMMRTQGAVAITARADGSVIARYSERGIDHAAAARAREWFHANAGLTNITRAVEIDDQWIEGRHTGPNAAASAAAAFDGASPISARARHFDYEIARLPLSYVTDERMVRMLSAVSQTKAEPGYLRDLAAGLNIMDSVAFLRVCSGQVVSTWAGRRLGVNQQAVIGRELSERSDLRYAEMLRQHVQEPINDNAPVFRRMRVSIDGRGFDYERIAMAEPVDRHGVRFVLTMPRILQSEGVAA